MTTMAALLGALPLMIGTAPAPNCATRSVSPSSRLIVSQMLTLSPRR